MTKYILRVHADTVVDIPTLKPIRHSGYDLIIIASDGTVTIETIDFSSEGDWGSNAIIELGKGPAYNLSSNEKPFYWGTQLTEEEINANNPEAIELAYDDNALQIFNKIKLEAALTNLMELDYDVFFDKRVCNTATQYWAEKYIPGYQDKSIFE